MFERISHIGIVAHDIDAALRIRVLANDLHADALSAVRTDVEAVGGTCEPLPGDVTAKDFGDRAVAACVERLGGLDILINNAGDIWNSLGMAPRPPGARSERVILTGTVAAAGTSRERPLPPRCPARCADRAASDGPQMSIA